MRRSILMTLMAIRRMKVMIAHRGYLGVLARLFSRRSLAFVPRQASEPRATTATRMPCEGNEIWVVHHIFPGTAEATCPRPRGRVAKNICKQLFRALAVYCSRQQRAQSVCNPAKSVPIPECCTNVHPDLIHVPPLGSDAVIRALRSALHTRHSMVRDCCAAKVQNMTRRRLQVLQ
ncbi:hypothetical protein IG631_23599 [Alternaria alternata]|nr:hypothetical protein IG631_23599 [Alternaria alternata]